MDELENLILLKEANKKKETIKSDSSVFYNFGNSDFNKKEILPQYRDGESDKNQDEFIISGNVGDINKEDQSLQGQNESDNKLWAKVINT